MNPYLGHPSQMHGVEEHRLVGGAGDGMRLLEVRNGRGLEMTLSPDRCADIARLTFRGNNFGFFSPCGHVAPTRYDKGDFLNSFTAGFMTTCGLKSFGPGCEDEGEVLPLHGTANILPAEHLTWQEEENAIRITAIMRDAKLFSEHLELRREYLVSLTDNAFVLTDTIKNVGPRPSPAMVLYHCNMGYPLLSERAFLLLPSDTVTPRDERAAEGLDNCRVIEKPQADFAEQCYFHTFGELGVAGVFNPDLGCGLTLEFDPAQLPYFTQWKMMGEYEYVMGLEPSTAPLKSRDQMRRDGDLRILAPGEEMTQSITFRMLDNNYLEMMR